MIAQLRVRGREILMSGLDQVPDEYEKNVDHLDGESFADYVQRHEPNLLDDLDIHTLPSIIESQLLNGMFLQSHWAARGLGWSDLDLVIGDRPLIYEGQMASDFLFVLPLAPKVAFFATNDNAAWGRIKKTKPSSLVRTLNKHTVQQAYLNAFAVDDSQTALIKRYLRRPEAFDDRALLIGKRGGPGV